MARSTRQLKVSHPARRDLQLIGTYSQREWGVVQKKKYLGQIKTCLISLQETPRLGKSRGEIATGLYSYPVQKHVVFYRIAKHEVLVIRILHESMDIFRHLDKTPITDQDSN